MQTGQTPNDDATQVALVLDAGGARSAYQVGALEVLIPALAERGDSAPLAGRHQRRCTARGRAQRDGPPGAGRPDRAAQEHAQPDHEAARDAAVVEAVAGSARALHIGDIGPVVLPSARVVRKPASRPTPSRSSSTGRPCTATSTDGVIESAAVTATSVRTGRVIVFTESGSPLPHSAPEYHGRFVATRLDVPHLMASAAIPVLFPSVHVDEPAEAAGWYVDGATRRRAPLAPALELGADRVVVVGTGGLRPPAQTPTWTGSPSTWETPGPRCSARSWTTRCDTTCGGSRSSTR